MKYTKETEVALELAVAAGLIIKQAYLTTINAKLKEDGSPVTNADMASDKLITEGLKKAFPLDGIVSEESGNTAGKRHWYIDPVDGTRGLVERTDQFAVHIGLAVDGDPVLGIVHKPLTEETYVGVTGQGAYKIFSDGRRSELNPRVPISGTLTAVVQTKWSEYNQFNPLFTELGVNEVIFTGSEGLRVMKIVEGLADIRVGKAKLNTWDVAAPDAILRAAGGITTYADGTPIKYTAQREFGKTILYSSSKTMLENILQGVNKYE